MLDLRTLRITLPMERVLFNYMMLLSKQSALACDVLDL